MNDALARWLAGTPADAPSPAAARRRKPNPVVRKLLGNGRFFDAFATLEPRLSPGAVALWCWLWTAERKGHSRCTASRLGERFRVSKSTAERWLYELRKAGFVVMVRRGKPGRSASVVRVRCSPDRKSDRPLDRPAGAAR